MAATRTARAETIRQMLAEGRYDLSVGRVRDVVASVRTEPKRLDELLECLWDDNPGVMNRAADSLERLPRDFAELLNPWKGPLLGLLSEARQNKLRWNLALTVPRLALSRADCRRVAEVFNIYLDDPSSIVKTAALQGLADLTRQEPNLLPGVLDLLRLYSRSGTAAVRARCRILLKKLEKPATARVARQPRKLPG